MSEVASVASLESRLQILEALVARVLAEIRVQHISVEPPPGVPVSVPTLQAAARASSSPPSPVEPPPVSAPPTPFDPKPEPHPDWLPVLHAHGPAACHTPALYLTQRVSGVRRADPTLVRILPRVQDPTSPTPGLVITEPWRAPISSDLVRCAGCLVPIEIWTSQDLDYRPHLDDEIDQPLYPRRASAFSDEERLAQLKAQAAHLREQVTREDTRVSLPFA